MQEDAHNNAQRCICIALKWNAHYAHEVQIALDSPYYSIGWGKIVLHGEDRTARAGEKEKKFILNIFLSEIYYTEMYNVMYYTENIYGKCILQFAQDGS